MPLTGTCKRERRCGAQARSSPFRVDCPAEDPTPGGEYFAHCRGRHINLDATPDGAVHSKTASRLQPRPGIMNPIGAARILVPTDFSDSSHAALEYGGTLARAFGARLSVLHVEP